MNVYVGILVATLSAMGLVVFLVLVADLIGHRNDRIGEPDADRMGRAMVEDRIYYCDTRDYLPKNFHRVTVETVDCSRTYITEIA